MILASAFLGSLVGYMLGLGHNSDYSAWEDLASELKILHLPNFLRVAYIHNASYLGATVGLIAAIIYLQKQKQLNACRTDQ